MAVIELRGRINEQGELEVTLPSGLPPGDVQMRLEFVATEDVSSDDEPWTVEELEELLRTEELRTGAEIAAFIAESGIFGAWADYGIEDSLEWVLEQRRKEEGRRNIQW